MKFLRLGLTQALLLAVLISCGKDNESGKSTYTYNPNPYCSGGYCSPYTGTVGAIPSAIPYANLAQFANMAQADNPCAAGTTYYANTRIPIQTQMTLNGVIAAGDGYLGVTSYGDVAVIVGNGTNIATLHAYLCPRVGSSGQGFITRPSLGSLSMGCQVKPIVAMDMIFPDGQVAKFRDPALGVRHPITGQYIRKFSFCAQ